MHVLFPMYLHSLGNPPPSAFAIDIGAVSDQQEVWLPTLPPGRRHSITSLLIRYAFKLFWGSENSVVSIATRLWAGWSEVQIPADVKTFFFSPNRPNRLWDLPSFLFYGYWCSFPVVQRRGRETDSCLLVLCLRISGAIPMRPICLNGLDRNVLILVCSSTSVL